MCLFVVGPNVKMPDAEKKFVCAECGGRFAHLSHLRVHMRLHAADLRHECHTCGERFLWRNSLKRHRWKFHGEKLVEKDRNHSCPTCAKSFHTPYLLRVHMQSHSGVKNHQCHQCGRRYARRSTLLCHQTYSHFAQVVYLENVPLEHDPANFSVCQIAPCGLRGCKNSPAPFPGWMSYRATKPDSVCPASNLLTYVLWEFFMLCYFVCSVSWLFLLGCRAYE